MVYPSSISLTIEEVNSITMTDNGLSCKNGELYGIPYYISHYGEEKREYQEKSLKSCNFTMLKEVDRDYLLPKFDYIFNDLKNQFQLELKAQLLTDDTEISHTFECDPWKWIKEKLHITKWFPIKTKTIKIDGRVLYPKLNIQFPHNTHTVKFKIS